MNASHDLRPDDACIYPLVFSTQNVSPGAHAYLDEPLIRLLLEFFEKKGLATIKHEDAREQWYDDWLVYQARHQLYARLLTPRQFLPPSAPAANPFPGFNLLTLTRFLEAFAWCSPAHGYSLQVSFLGLFSILMGTSDTLKHEALAALAKGGLLAFGISEKAHGSDLIATEFTLSPASENRLLANGTKYYIGNANSAAMVAILARKEDGRPGAAKRRAPLTLFALRPPASPGYKNVQKIPTFGIRAAFVGSFDVVNHELPATDILAEGRDAWDAVFGTVTLGKFFLGFGSIGICEHALHEAATHLARRILYGKPAIQMPHLQAMMAQAFARLTAMKLYAYRALDYIHAASETDRRYLLYAAVQKAKVSTEGVKVMALLSECIGAKGFEADTFFEMALRDIQLIPALEGSAHINLAMTTQFNTRHPSDVPTPPPVPSLQLAPHTAAENPYLFQAKTAPLNTIIFPDPLDAFAPLAHIPNVQRFTTQLRGLDPLHDQSSTLKNDLPFAAIRAIITYAQLIAEHAALLHVPPPIVSAIFHHLILDLNAAILSFASTHPGALSNLQSLITIPDATDCPAILAYFAPQNPPSAGP